jgi:hypothetical protein
MIAMHSSKELVSDTVSGLAVMIFETIVCFALLFGNNTLMAQSPWETIPTNIPSSMTRTDLTRLSRINNNATSTESDDLTEKIVLVF